MVATVNGWLPRKDSNLDFDSPSARTAVVILGNYVGKHPWTLVAVLTNVLKIGIAD